MRWVYLDIGKFGGLAETMDEAIRYPIRTDARRRPRWRPACSPARPAIRPTCSTRRSPTCCRSRSTIGDEVLIEGTGAYTTTYSAVAFNGFPPLKSLRDLTGRRLPRSSSRPERRDLVPSLIVEDPGSRLGAASGMTPLRMGRARPCSRSAKSFRPTSRPARRCSTRAFGHGRFAKTCERLREGRLPADGLSLVPEHDGALVGTVRLWHVAAGPGRPALLLGPLAVAAASRASASAPS